MLQNNSNVLVGIDVSIQQSQSNLIDAKWTAISIIILKKHRYFQNPLARPYHLDHLSAAPYQTFNQCQYQAGKGK